MLNITQIKKNLQALILDTLSPLENYLRTFTTPLNIAHEPITQKPSVFEQATLKSINPYPLAKKNKKYDISRRRATTTNKK